MLSNREIISSKNTPKPCQIDKIFGQEVDSVLTL